MIVILFNVESCQHPLIVCLTVGGVPGDWDPVLSTDTSGQRPVTRTEHQCQQSQSGFNSRTLSLNQPPNSSEMPTVTTHAQADVSNVFSEQAASSVLGGGMSTHDIVEREAYEEWEALWEVDVMSFMTELERDGALATDMVATFAAQKAKQIREMTEDELWFYHHYFAPSLELDLTEP
jgi:hypothetical protein